MKKTILAFMVSATLLSGCESPTDGDREVFALATVNSRPLPVPHPDVSALEIVSGTLTLSSGNVAEEALTVRCRADLPSGDDCFASGAPHVRTGTFSRTEGWIRFGDRQYPTDFTSASITANYLRPPSQGFGGAVYVFTRTAAGGS